MESIDSSFLSLSLSRTFRTARRRLFSRESIVRPSVHAVSIPSAAMRIVTGVPRTLLLSVGCWHLGAATRVKTICRKDVRH